MSQIIEKALPPSSKLLTMEVVCSIIGIESILPSWSPGEPPSIAEKSDLLLDFSSNLIRRSLLVDASESEIGLYPAIEVILLDGILNAGREDMIIVPQKRINLPRQSTTDFSVSVVSSSSVSNPIYVETVH